MIDIVAMLNVAESLRTFATQIRRDNEATQYLTAGLDAGLLEKTAKHLEEAANEIERLRKARASSTQ
jgi:hypothetical protein